MSTEWRCRKADLHKKREFYDIYELVKFAVHAARAPLWEKIPVISHTRAGVLY